MSHDLRELVERVQEMACTGRHVRSADLKPLLAKMFALLPAAPHADDCDCHDCAYRRLWASFAHAAMPTEGSALLPMNPGGPFDVVTLFPATRPSASVGEDMSVAMVLPDMKAKRDYWRNTLGDEGTARYMDEWIALLEAGQNRFASNALRQQPAPGEAEEAEPRWVAINAQAYHGLIHSEFGKLLACHESFTDVEGKRYKTVWGIGTGPALLYANSDGDQHHFYFNAAHSLRAGVTPKGAVSAKQTSDFRVEVVFGSCHEAAVFAAALGKGE